MLAWKRSYIVNRNYISDLSFFFEDVISAELLLSCPNGGEDVSQLEDLYFIRHSSIVVVVS